MVSYCVGVVQYFYNIEAVGFERVKERLFRFSLAPSHRFIAPLLHPTSGIATD
jgi:hypothetical protein